MPWCDVCDRLVEEEDLDEGSCPTCATSLTAEVRAPMPWRFRLMIGATVVYLGWRIWQGIDWLMR